MDTKTTGRDGRPTTQNFGRSRRLRQPTSDFDSGRCERRGQTSRVEGGSSRSRLAPNDEPQPGIQAEVVLAVAVTAGNGKLFVFGTHITRLIVCVCARFEGKGKCIDDYRHDIDLGMCVCVFEKQKKSIHYQVTHIRGRGVRETETDGSS